MSRAPRILGLMSGTSADGIDAALLELPGWPGIRPGQAFPALPAGVPRGRVVAHTFKPYSRDLRHAVMQAIEGHSDSVALTQLHWALGEAYAEAAADLAADADLIACHGQTVQHHPQVRTERGWARPATLQLGEVAPLAQHTGKPVIADFRPADVAAGGVGAPLVPFADWALFAQQSVKRVVLNIGGIANLTYLPSLDPLRVVAFDTGPGNCLIDEVAALQGQTFDEGGRLAASSKPHAPTLLGWLAHPELQAPPPKATGREVWSLEQLGLPGLSLPDLAATTTAFTARSIADAFRFLPQQPQEVIIAGGGARNPTLMRALAEALSPIPLRTFAELGWDDQGFTDSTREAAAFAFLGYARAQGWANTLPHTTGARHAVSAGKLTPAPPSAAPLSVEVNA